MGDSLSYLDNLLTMATKPIKFLELHYTMTQFLITRSNSNSFNKSSNSLELVFKAVKNRKRSGYVDCQRVRSIDRNLFFSKLKLLTLRQ